MTHPAVPGSSPAAEDRPESNKAGKRTLTAIAVKHTPRMGIRLVGEILTALDEQTVVVPGTQAAETIGSQTRR